MARKRTDYIIIHCTATRASQDIDIKDVDRWHREKGWRMVGYHFFIKRDGTLQEGRQLMHGGAHATGYNDKSIGICMAGGMAADGKTSESNFTRAQWATLRSLVLKLHVQFPQAKIIGHRDVAVKDCPCFDVAEWWKKQTVPSAVKPWHKHHLPT